MGVPTDVDRLGDVQKMKLNMVGKVKRKYNSLQVAFDQTRLSQIQCQLRKEFITK